MKIMTEPLEHVIERFIFKNLNVLEQKIVENEVFSYYTVFGIRSLMKKALEKYIKEELKND